MDFEKTLFFLLKEMWSFGSKPASSKRNFVWEVLL